MAATTVWILPGFGGSELWWVNGRNRRKLWIDIGTVFNGVGLRALRLPGPPVGSVAAPNVIGNEMGYGYRALLEFLQTQVPSDWTVKTWPYDWRQSAQMLGQAFANQLLADGPQPGGHRVIGHSYGAIVALGAWRYLSDAGQANLVPRIVSIAGILSGSYSVAKTWREEEDTVNLLSLTTTLDPLTLLLPFRPRVTFLSPAEVIDIFNSWPSCYDMLPDPAAGDDPADVHRLIVWNAAYWSDALQPPTQQALDTSRLGFQAWFHQPQSSPPPGVLVCLCGVEQDTAHQLRPRDTTYSAVPPSFWGAPTLNRSRWIRQQKLPYFTPTRQGDNRATLASQIRPGVQYSCFVGAHAELHMHPGVHAALLDALTGPGQPGGLTLYRSNPRFPDPEPGDTSQSFAVKSA